MPSLPFHADVVVIVVNVVVVVVIVVVIVIFGVGVGEHRMIISLKRMRMWAATTSQ